MNQSTLNQNLEKVKTILLNKLSETDKWYYFELPLDEIKTRPANRELVAPDKFLDSFKKNSTTGVMSFDSGPKPRGTQNGSGSKTSNLLPLLNSMIKYLEKDDTILPEVMRRIFDRNEILNESAAAKGNLGFWNKAEKWVRNRKYFKKINRGIRARNGIVILAEGDSWFHFPRIFRFIRVVKDIIYHLKRVDNFAVYTLAAGGDWLSNILYTNEYIEELPKISPDVFLVSGGGNDMVGDHRLTTMVRNRNLEGPRDLTDPSNSKIQKLIEKRGNEIEAFQNSDEEFERYKFGIQMLSDEFFQFINICMVQYFFLFQNLSKPEKYKKMMIITQGYDFPIPNNSKLGAGVIGYVVKHFQKNGKWLFTPLAMKGITNPEEQRAVTFAMIFEFNEMMIQLANYFDNVFHIDCRGYAQPTNWFDELHLKSAPFGDVTNTFIECINENLHLRSPNPTKVYRVNPASQYYSAQRQPQTSQTAQPVP